MQSRNLNRKGRRHDTGSENISGWKECQGQKLFAGNVLAPVWCRIFVFPFTLRSCIDCGQGRVPAAVPRLCVKPAAITGRLLRAPPAGGSGVVPAWAGFCNYVPAGVSVKTSHGSGTAQADASRAELERSAEKRWPRRAPQQLPHSPPCPLDSPSSKPSPTHSSSRRL